MLLETAEPIALMAPDSRAICCGSNAQLETEAGAGHVFLPALDSGSHEHPDQQVRFGRQADWTDDGGPVSGRGLRMLLAGNDALTLLEWADE